MASPYTASWQPFKNVSHYQLQLQAAASSNSVTRTSLSRGAVASISSTSANDERTARGTGPKRKEYRETRTVNINHPLSRFLNVRGRPKWEPTQPSIAKRRLRKIAIAMRPRVMPTSLSGLAKQALATTYRK